MTQSIPTSNCRFFVAFLPPQAVQDYAIAVQQEFVDRYQSHAALKSPPHITLQPPFAWAIAALPRLSDRLAQFAMQQTPVPIELSGFGAFVPRVVFINGVKTPELLTVQQALTQHLETTLGICDRVGKTRSFASHMTVGFRDLTPEKFQAAWTEFQHRPVQFEFIATHLTLLIHTGQRWTVHSEFELGDRLRTRDS